MPEWVGRIPRGLFSPIQRTLVNLEMVVTGQMVLSREEPYNWLPSTKLPVLKTYIQVTSVAS